MCEVASTWGARGVFRPVETRPWQEMRRDVTLTLSHVSLSAHFHSLSLSLLLLAFITFYLPRFFFVFLGGACHLQHWSLYLSFFQHSISSASQNVFSFFPLKNPNVNVFYWEFMWQTNRNDGIIMKCKENDSWAFNSLLKLKYKACGMHCFQPAQLQIFWDLSPSAFLLPVSFSGFSPSNLTELELFCKSSPKSFAETAPRHDTATSFSMSIVCSFHVEITSARRDVL